MNPKTFLSALFLAGCSTDTFLDPSDGEPPVLDGGGKDALVIVLDAGDAGSDGMTEGGASDSALPMEAETGPSFKRVFISSTATPPNFGGLTAGDNICQTAANSASLGGTWKAWLSTSTTSAASRLAHAAVPYELVDGTVVASDWNHLVSGVPLKSSIYLDENGTFVPWNSDQSTGWTWTGTNTDGTAGTTCVDWTMAADCSISTSLHGTAGADNDTDYEWTAYTVGIGCCSVQVFSLYCLEQ
jgi:hypothetical protein